MLHKISIWGTGSVAKKLYLLNYKKYEVVCFYDNNKEKQGQTLYGIPIKEYDGSEKNIIVIGSSFWKEISWQLIKSNKKIIQDFIPYIFWHPDSFSYNDLYALGKKNALEIIKYVKEYKKIAVIYGNCQTLILSRILMIYPSFREEYCFIKILPVCEYNSETGKTECDNLLNNDLFWKKIDLFIFQKVLETNRFYKGLATKYILKKLSETCQTVQITNIYFNGYFFQAERRKKIKQDRFFPYTDRYIDEMLEIGISEDEIIQKICDTDFIDKKLIYTTVQNSINTLFEREKGADVVIADYIEKNYNKCQLFYSFNHPTNAVLMEYAKRIIRYLKLEDTEIDESVVYIKAGTLKGQDIPVYPAIKQALGLNRGGSENLYFSNRYINSEFLFDFKEYCRKYIHFSIDNKLREIEDY